MDAYSKEPHRQFIGAEDDRALQYFLKAWGPLWIGLGDQTGDWTGKCSMVLVRRERDELIAWTRLFTALEILVVRVVPTIQFKLQLRYCD